jgi:hypothetical protein
MSSEDKNVDMNQKAHANRLRAVAIEVKQESPKTSDLENSPAQIAAAIQRTNNCVSEIAFSMALLIEGNLATKAEIPHQPCPWHDRLKERHDDLETALREHKQAAQPVIDGWEIKQAHLKKMTDGFWSGIGSQTAWALVAGLISAITVLAGALWILKDKIAI